MNSNSLSSTVRPPTSILLLRTASRSCPSEMLCALSRFGSTTIEYRSEEHTSELQSLMRISYAVFCLKKKNLQRVVTALIAKVIITIERQHKTNNTTPTDKELRTNTVA